MNRLRIPVLPHIVNALILSSVFSAGNAFLYCGSRSWAQMAKDGMLPKFFAKKNRNGKSFTVMGLLPPLLTRIQSLTLPSQTQVFPFTPSESASSSLSSLTAKCLPRLRSSSPTCKSRRLLVRTLCEARLRRNFSSSIHLILTRTQHTALDSSDLASLSTGSSCRLPGSSGTRLSRLKASPATLFLQDLASSHLQPTMPLFALLSSS